MELLESTVEKFDKQFIGNFFINYLKNFNGLKIKSTKTKNSMMIYNCFDPNNLQVKFVKYRPVFNIYPESNCCINTLQKIYNSEFNFHILLFLNLCRFQAMSLIHSFFLRIKFMHKRKMMDVCDEINLKPPSSNFIGGTIYHSIVNELIHENFLI